MRFCPLSIEKLRYFYEKFSKFQVLFNNYVENDLDAFIYSFIDIDRHGEVHPKGLIWEVDDVGVFFLTDIQPEWKALAHFTFWDQQIRGRETLVRKALEHSFESFKFHRIEVQIPLYAQPALKATERIGFKKEGRLREAVFYKNEWFDVNVYSMLAHEVRDGGNR